MNNSVEIQQKNSQYVRQFNRAVLDYEVFIFEERQQRKTATINSQKRIRNVKNRTSKIQPCSKLVP
jgi:hypothetical protein